MDGTSRVVVRSEHGSVIGERKDGIVRFRGIKYATAARFERPSPIEKWGDDVDCTRPAPICAQRPSRLNFITGDMNRGREISEDCLNLTITAPASALEEHTKLPVMVWFHGGAFVSGGGDLDNYFPGSLSSRGLVVVNVTYRLGIFGWMPMDGIAPANLGLMDQLESLRWVQKNISSFGGDPARVTVVGQSAGAQSVYCLMLADDAQGLFQRAILQSAPFGVPHVPKEAADKLGRAAAGLVQQSGSGPPTTQELLNIEIQLSLESQKLGLMFAFWPQFGHYPLPQVSEIGSKVQRAAKAYPILVGWTQNEGRAFVPMFFRDAFWKRLPIVGSLITTILSWRVSGTVFIWPAQEFHRAFIQAGGVSSTACFQWYPPDSPHQAAHCIDLPLLFGSWDSWKDSPMVQGAGSQEAVERIGSHVKNLWAAFASRDDPSSFQSRNFNIARDFLYTAP